MIGNHTISIEYKFKVWALLDQGQIQDFRKWGVGDFFFNSVMETYSKELRSRPYGAVLPECQLIP